MLDPIRFSPDTTGFTPIFNKIEGLKSDVMITGVSHVGTQPTVQWKRVTETIPSELATHVVLTRRCVQRDLARRVGAAADTCLARVSDSGS